MTQSKTDQVMIDTAAGAKSSAIIYSIAETANANYLDDTDRTFLDNLLPWSPNLPANCRKADKILEIRIFP